MSANGHIRGGWEFWIDRGGTFTDIVARSPKGHVSTLKLLSQDTHYSDSAMEGVRRILGKEKLRVTSEVVSKIKMGTTVATNALLERKGEPTVLLITCGFKDALRIGYQNRPRLFDKHIVLPGLLYSRVVEIEERLDASGNVIVPIDIVRTEKELRKIFDAGYRSVAVALLHAYKNPVHEAEIGRLAEEMGFEQISLSHRISPLIKLVTRGNTTVVDAYLSPVLKQYVRSVEHGAGNTELYFMQSNGGLTRSGHFHGKDAVLSGPAGGVVGMVKTAKEAGYTKIIGFDMGGTSTDVSHFAGEYEREFDTIVAGVRMRAPMLGIHTVAAGGGSILHFENGRMMVGPDSAGADPGPASYRRGGPLTITDCNVLLGRIQPKHFPPVFGEKANQNLDRDIVVEKFQALATDILLATGNTKSPEQLAEGFLEIGVRNMAAAIAKITVARGYDVTGYVLNTFGGAGGQHACQVAEQLGIREVFIHAFAGVLSAYGIGLADQSAIRERSVEHILDPENLAELKVVLEGVEAEARHELVMQGVSSDAVSVVRIAHLRYRGTDTSLPVSVASLETMKHEFEMAYKARFSFELKNRPIIVSSVTVEAVYKSGVEVSNEAIEISQRGIAQAQAEVKAYFAGKWTAVPLYERRKVEPHTMLPGPCIISDANSTTVVEPGWRAVISSQGHIVLRQVAHTERRRDVNVNVDPVMLEIFNNRFMSIAEQMGLRLQQTAQSVNIKERLDFSCALFDSSGNLLANAPHIPVHLGSMGESVKALIADVGKDMSRGDAFASNDPYRGGTHLPDITVITPVFGQDNATAKFYVASRGHHSDIGGITPGSMPPNSTSVEQEGILFRNWKLVENGSFREAETVAHLLAGSYPARNAQQNIADLRAQIAANAKGTDEILRMIDEFGFEVVRAYTEHVQDNAEAAVREVVSKLDNGNFRLEMDSGAVIQVSIRVDHQRRSAIIDFTGTSAQQSDNLNAPASVCVAAVLYAFRCLVDRDIPLNAGCLRPLRLIIPAGSMLNPSFPGAVVAGNVETSQCITNAIFGALKVMGASQCTMNSLTFGNERYQYYETIAGGSGAGRGFNGTDVVQTNMTNSLITDPEVLEHRYPVRLERFEIRKGSEGAGTWHGGAGAIRQIRCLEPMAVSILSNNRRTAPFGMCGGRAGKPGRNVIERNDGTQIELAYSDSVVVDAGDRIVIETPGGGGFGTPGDEGE